MTLQPVHLGLDLKILTAGAFLDGLLVESLPLGGEAVLIEAVLVRAAGGEGLLGPMELAFIVGVEFPFPKFG